MDKCGNRWKKAQGITLSIIDSQAVQSTCNAGVDSKGFCFYKATNGIKRHLAVDTLRFPFFTHCTKANVSDDAGLIELLTLNIDYFKSKPVKLLPMTISLEQGYHPAPLTAVWEKVYPQTMQKIKFQLATKTPKQEKSAQGKAAGSFHSDAHWKYDAGFFREAQRFRESQSSENVLLPINLRVSSPLYTTTNRIGIRTSSTAQMPL